MSILKKIVKTQEKAVKSRIDAINADISQRRIDHGKALEELESLRRQHPDYSLLIDSEINSVKSDAKSVVEKNRHALRSHQWKLTDRIEQDELKLDKYGREIAKLNPNSREYKIKSASLEKIYNDYENSIVAQQLIDKQIDALPAGETASGGSLESLLGDMMLSVHTISTISKTVTHKVNDFGDLWSEVVDAQSATPSGGSLIDVMRRAEKVGTMDERINPGEAERRKAFHEFLNSHRTKVNMDSSGDNEEILSKIRQIDDELKVIAHEDIS